MNPLQPEHEESPSPPKRPFVPWLSATGLFALGAYIVVTRFWRLDLKPVQHDESMFAFYGWQIFRGTGYEFMAILHGPVLQFASALVFRLFGDSDVTMRLFPALSGIGIFVLLFLMREGFGRRGAYWGLVFLALSPTIMFFSRFCRNDIPFLFAVMLMIYCGWRYSRRHHPIWLIAWFSVLGYAICIKETYMIFLFLSVTFAFGCWIHMRVKFIAWDKAPVCRDLRIALIRHGWACLIGLTLMCGIIVIFYTSFFQYMNHWDGPYEAFRYWLGQHKEDRIRGAFHFYLIHMAIYELPFMVFWIACVVQQMWPTPDDPARGVKRRLFIAWFILSWLTLALFWDKKLHSIFYRLLHIDMGLHVWLFVQLFIVIGVTGWKHLNRGRVLHAFVDYWAAGSFLAYSYAGEKVPWVTTHIVLPMLISCGLYADLLLKKFLEPEPGASKPSPVTEPKTARKKIKGRRKKQTPKSQHVRNPEQTAAHGKLHPSMPAILTKFATTLRYALALLFMIGLGWELYLSLFLCFFNSGSPIERYTYASSHTDFHREIRQVLKEADELYQGEDTSIMYQGTCEWPLVWTLRNYKNSMRWVRPTAPATFAILDTKKWDGLKPSFKDLYDWKRVRFRHYWQPRPLNWTAMKKVGLLPRREGTLSPAQREARRLCRREWGTFLSAMFKRDEDEVAPYRWDHIGGWDVYVGRLRSGGASGTG